MIQLLGNIRRNIKKFQVGFIVAFVLVLVSTIYLFQFIGIELNNNMIFFVLLTSLGVATIIKFRKKFHQGHFPLIFGMIAVVIGFTAFVGTMYFTFDGMDGQLHTKNQWWPLTYQQAGVFILVGIFGLVLITAGSKQALANIWFWGRR